MKDDKKESRVGIINAISTPIQLAALIVLVVEGLLGYLLSKAETKDISLYVIIMVIVLVITILSAFVVEYMRIKLKQADILPPTGGMESDKKTYKWDVFLAAPMAALGTDDFETSMNKVREIKTVLEDECNFKRVFFAGANMKTKEDFDTADVSIEIDVNALRESQNFVMVYPDKIVSSVLFEAGFAFALGKPSFYFGHKDNFPFLMQEANQRYNHVKIHEAESTDKIIKMIRKNRAELFKIEKAQI